MTYEIDGTCSAQRGDEERIHNFVRKPKGEINILRNINVDGIIILKWTLKQCDIRMNYRAASGHSTVADFCEHGNESSDSIYFLF
jgi:hypothetical protein